MDVHVDQQLLGESADGDSLPDDSLPDVPLPNVPFPDFPLPDVPLLDALLPGVPPDDLVWDERTHPRVAEEVIVVEFRLGSGSCLVCFICSYLSISGIDHYTHREVLASLRV